MQQAFIDASLEKQDEGAWGASELKRSSLALNHDGTWSFGTPGSARTGRIQERHRRHGRSEATDTIIEGSLTRRSPGR